MAAEVPSATREKRLVTRGGAEFAGAGGDAVDATAFELRYFRRLPCEVQTILV